MQRALFTHRLHDATSRARDFARTFVEEPLPDAMLFRVSLNASYDGNPLHADERVFPKDGTPELARSLSSCTAREVVDVLWRDARIPEWINIAVCGETDAATRLEVLACGRFTSNDALLYHQHEGYPPFHVLGPSLPVGFQQGQRFSIYDQTACWSRAELARVVQHAGKVRSLELHGADLDDAAIATLPVFERLEILQLRDAPLDGTGLSSTTRLPQMRHLRIHRSGGDAFSVRHLPKLRRLEGLTIENLPSSPWGFSGLAASVPNLRDLSLSSAGGLVLDAPLPKHVESLTLRARSIVGDPAIEHATSIHLHLSDASDDDVARLLARAKNVRRLSLRGTPVSERVVEELVSRWSLESLDVVGTSVGGECIQRLCAKYPKLRALPTPDVAT